jgi:hypothetical protein
MLLAAFSIVQFLEMLGLPLDTWLMLRAEADADVAEFARHD